MFQELRDSKQSGEDCLPFSFVTFSLYSKSVLSERAELKKAKQVWITSGKAL